ncbi:MAG TPA: HEAT repeat domain-containing protein [Candidatus Binatia bacterium]|nr:HEAT repeat domain-containing protein [Candidatus Binatia bacterium]
MTFGGASALHYDGALISAEIDNVQLGKVLGALGQKTGLQVQLIDPAIANWPVSASMKAAPLDEGIREILDGFSYVFYFANNIPVVIVLSTHPDAARTGFKTAVGRAEQISPLSLDEFQPLRVEEPSSGSGEEGDQDPDPVVQAAQEYEYNEVLLRRALDALNSKHTHLRAEALDQLADVQDPRATQALVEAASGRTNLDPQYRLQAVTALSRQAFNMNFIDTVSVDALKQLAGDSDENVRGVARQALQDMQQRIHSRNGK